MITEMSTRVRRALALVVVAGTLALPAAASAQQDSGDTTTTTAPEGVDVTAPTTAPPSSATSSSTTTTSTTLPVPPEEPPEEAPTAEPPPEAVIVPPAEEAAIVEDLHLKQLVARQLGDAKAIAATTQLLLTGAEHKVATLESEFHRLDARRATLQVEQKRAVRRFEAARIQLQERATMAFIRGPARHLSVILDSKGPNDFSRRMELIQSVLDADQDVVDEYRAAKKALKDEVVQLILKLGRARDELFAARLELLAAANTVGRVRAQLSALESGNALAASGFAFPVGEPYNFVDTFGAPRMPGTQYEHLHQGTDIFAPTGTPLYAVERGVITKMGADVLGGTKLWLVGMSGNRYYYAHLSAYAEGIAEGQVVEAGAELGFVGDTGNARGGVPHLHFEIHPAVGGAANPYPILKMLSDAVRAAAEADGAAT